VRIPNFNDQYAAPDLGAHQSGTSAMTFGVTGQGTYLAGWRNVRRNLFVTVKMLQAGGLAADVKFARGLIEVQVDQHRATFAASKPGKAADWLVACAVMNYPESDLSKLWRMLATAAGGAIPFGSR